MTDHDLVLVVDFGAQYAQLIARRVREARVYSEIVPHTMPVAEMLAREPAAIILSGGPSSVYSPGAPAVDGEMFGAGVPVFGMCYGFQAMAQALGGEVARTGSSEYGRTPVTVSAPGTLLADLPAAHRVWMSHGDSVQTAPAGFDVLASTTKTPVAAFEDTERRLAGVQWHPEVLHTEHGQKVMEHFLLDIAGCRPTWTMVNIVEEQVERIQQQIGPDGLAICALSGGVDSAVAAAVVQRAIGDRLTCVYVDHGLMRKGESEQIERDFVAATGADLVVVDAEKQFLDALAGVSDPETKRKIIGREFIRVFEAAEADILAPKIAAGSHAEGATMAFLVQGTLYPDVVESGGERAPPTSSRTTTWAGCPTTSSSSWSSRCARCSRTRSASSASSWASPPSWSGATRSRVPASASGSSARSPASGSTSCARPTRSPARSSPGRGWTATSGSSRWCCWPTYAPSACRATAAPTATRSCCGRSPPRTR